MRQLGLACYFALAAVTVGPSAHAAQVNEKAGACTAPENRQFDFWLGDWDVFETRGHSQAVARVQVESILKGCALQETYRDAEGYEGRSFSIYDATRRTWHQSWVTNKGILLVIEGHFNSGVMELSGTDLAAAGGPQRLVRGTWQATDGGVREIATRSTDDGKSWQPWFDLMFRPHAK